tara:strand:+ start:406 stop:510 length:105 start_codon:yes stop_codon:yes gene_type:complete
VVVKTKIKPKETEVKKVVKIKPKRATKIQVKKNH